MKKPPEITISRLAMYLRFLEDYSKEKFSKQSINSSELAQLLDLNPHQIRKDLSYFGKFGERGLGYRVEDLKEKIKQILGLGKRWNLCICGAGNLGSALLAYKGFTKMHLNIVAAFDNDRRKIGRSVNGVEIFPAKNIPSVVKKMHIDMAIIAVPASAAQDMTQALISAGIRAILNFAPARLTVPPGVKLRQVDLSAELVSLSYFLSSFR